MADPKSSWVISASKHLTFTSSSMLFNIMLSPLFMCSIAL
nr:MAG TPA: hypothetical protein [Caudoviricetes sp.]